MRVFGLLVLAILLLSGMVAADTTGEIQHLLGFVAASPCKFERNGSVHDGPEARDHIKRKYEYYRDKVKTAEDFIKYSATRSKLSGKKYKIDCPGFDQMNTSDWLLNELSEYRKNSKG